MKFFFATLLLVVGFLCLCNGADITPTFPSPISFQLFPDIGYRHKFSALAEETLAFERAGGVTWDPTVFPMRAFGAPGIALFDYDNDGDVDIYVTNGPGRANSLFQNQMQESGALSFIDVASSAGVAMLEDSTGVCAGDIDNDGDKELFVMTRYTAWKAFNNNGDGTFTEISNPADLNPTGKTPTHCSLGDIDNDGFLDLFVSRTFDWKDSTAIYITVFDLNEHNSVYRNQGPSGSPLFKEISFESGTRTSLSQPANISWAGTFVDLDIDGDVDLIVSNDMAAIPPPLAQGRGIINIFKNNGSGFFVDGRQAQANVNPGAHMGFVFADFNCDSYLDFFSSNIGDWFPPSNAVARGNFGAYSKGFLASQWYFGSSNGVYQRPGVGPLVDATPFAWGGSGMDFDNDGDQDLVWLGGLANGPQTDVCPGAVLENIGLCSGTFRRVQGFAPGAYTRRVVSGSGSADLNNDGWPDFISVSDHEVPPNGHLVDYRTLIEPYFNYTSPFTADYQVFWPWQTGFTGGAFRGATEQEGKLYIELNVPTAQTSKNNWIQVSLKGSKGLIPNGKVNRDGIGATLLVKPSNSGKTVISPMTSGAGYASEPSQAQLFGLGQDSRARVDVVWPGNVRNSFIVNKSERVTLPEIPCSYTAFPGNRLGFKACLNSELSAMQTRGLITPDQKGKYTASNINAWRRANGENVSD